MDFRLLQHLIVIAEEGGISAAARKVNVTQPALSRQMKALEDELGFAVLERGAHSVALTRAGEVLVKEGTRLLAAWEQTVAKARAAESEIVLRIGYAPSLANEFLGPAIERFRQIHPQARVSLFDQSTAEMRAALSDGKLDAIICMPGGGDSPSIEWQTVHQRNLWLAVASSHPVAGSGNVTPEQVVEFPLVMFDREHYEDYWRRVTEYFKGHKLNAKIAGEFDGITSLGSAVEANMGVALVAEGSRVGDAARVELLDLDPAPEPICVAIGRCGEREANPAVEVFIAEVARVAAELA